MTIYIILKYPLIFYNIRVIDKLVVSGRRRGVKQLSLNAHEIKLFERLRKSLKLIT